MAFTDQPVGNAKGESDGGQPEHLGRPDLVQVENDELAGDREQRDEKHHFRLDDALLALDHVLQGVVELERDEQRHDLAEHVLEHLLVEGIEDAGQHADDDGRGEAIKHDNYLERILKARVYDVASETPLELAPGLSRRLRNHLLIKREDLQPVFSFKLRGAYNKMAGLPRSRLARGVIAASAGNHAQGVALAAQRLGW